MSQAPEAEPELYFCCGFSPLDVAGAAETGALFSGAGTGTQAAVGEVGGVKSSIVGWFPRGTWTFSIHVRS